MGARAGFGADGKAKGEMRRRTWVVAARGETQDESRHAILEVGTGGGTSRKVHREGTEARGCVEVSTAATGEAGRGDLTSTAATGEAGRGDVENAPLVFINKVARHKPENIRHKEGYCPFCDRESLTNILRTSGDCIWLVNKYRTLEDTMQTVLVESANHTGDPSNYSTEENRHVFRFALSCWADMLRSGTYRSALMYKNYGPNSGGTLLHPHFQIVGLNHKDGYERVPRNAFDGVSVVREGGRSVTLSTHPIMGFVEVNVSVPVAGGDETAQRGNAREDGVTDCGGATGSIPETAAVEGTVPEHAEKAGMTQVGSARTARPIDVETCSTHAARPMVGETRSTHATRPSVEDAYSSCTAHPADDGAGSWPFVDATLAQNEDADWLADSTQKIIRYLLTNYHGHGCTSYNLFFYLEDGRAEGGSACSLSQKGAGFEDSGNERARAHTEESRGRVICKIVPRWVTSPYFVGYRISQVDCDETLEAVANELRPILEG